MRRIMQALWAAIAAAWMPELYDGYGAPRVRAVTWRMIIADIWCRICHRRRRQGI